MLTVTLKPDVAEQIEELADQTHTDAEELVDRALRAYLEKAQVSLPPVVKGRRYSFIRAGRTRNPRASVEAEEILEREVDRSDGWTTKP